MPFKPPCVNKHCKYFKVSYSKVPSIYITKDYHQFYIQNYIHIYYSVNIS